MLLACLVALSLAGPAATVRIDGAGATFPFLIYSKWFTEYNALHPDVQIHYEPIGSGSGIRKFTSQEVFFGATDGPMTREQLAAAAARGRILHIPTVLGAVVPIYQLPSVHVGLKLTGPLLADIFLGRVTRWNDPAIASINIGVLLPPADIIVVRRADASGTTYIWTDYLSKVSAAFKTQVGVTSSATWPTGVGGHGSDGVARLVAQTPGAIGYVELIYAVQHKLAYAAVQNAAGDFIKASTASVTLAAVGAAPTMSADFRVSITNAIGEGAYPISSFTWLLLYEHPRDKVRARAMVDFVRWALTDGQKYCGDLGYAPLPARVIRIATAQLLFIKTS